MTPRILSLTAMLCALTLTAVGTRARAAEIYLSAGNCMPAGGAPQNTLAHTTEGITTTAATLGADLWVSCSIPRMPLAEDGHPVVFRLSGIATPEAPMPCTINSFDYNGAFLGSATVVITAPAFPAESHYRPFVQEVSMPDALLPYWAYTSLSCLLPARLQGYISSITSAN